MPLNNDEIFPLHMDNHLLVVNKPAGLRTIPDGYQKDLPDLHHVLMERYGRLWVVHRLDRQTSGAVLFARDANTHRLLSLQFQNRQIKKVYHLLAIGSPATAPFEINYPLRVDGDRSHRTVIDFRHGKPAITHIHWIQSLMNGILLIEAQPLTGYTHQIRAHLSAVGCWLLHDNLYFPWNRPPDSSDAHPSLPEEYQRKSVVLPIRRLALHCWRMEFLHPISLRPFAITAPYPDDFNETVNLLKEKNGD